MGTLADELDFESDWEDGLDDRAATPSQVQSTGIHHQTSTPSSSRLESARHDSRVKGDRDSGVDVGCSPSPSHVKYLKLETRRQPARENRALSSSETTFRELPFGPDLEDALTDIASMVASDVLLVDMGNTWPSELVSQVELEAEMRTYRTAMDQISRHMARHLKDFLCLSTSFFSPAYKFQSPNELFSTTDYEAVVALLEEFWQCLPIPEPTPMEELSVLEQSSADLTETLSALLDTLQINRQVSSDAARTIRSVRQMTTELLYGYQAVENGQTWIDSGQWDHRLETRWCAAQCREVMSGFEETCDGLRKGLEKGLAI